MKPNPEKWFIGPDDESFEYYLALTRTIRAAKNIGCTESEKEVKILRKLREDFQRLIIWQFYEMQDLNAVDYGLPSVNEIRLHFSIGASFNEVVDWAIKKWNKKKARCACRIKD